MVSNDCALEHWQALNRLPRGAMNLLIARFLREQPLLSCIGLPLMDDLATGPDGKERVPDPNDPKLDGYWRIARTGAIMGEILCREAGRPLRKLEEAEVLETARASAEVFGRLGESGLLAEGCEGSIFTACSQRHLLVGAAISHSLETAPDRLSFPRLVLNFRILAEGLHRACGDDPASSPRSWDAERIQFALSTQGDPLRCEALAASDGFRGELVTDFLKELEFWAADPKAALEVDGSLGTQAMYLLGKWREEEAWPVFRKLFSLPSEINWDLLGDLVTEDGSILLAMVSGNRRDELREMIETETLCEYCRAACIDALTCLVAWGELPREAHIAYLRDLLTGRLRAVPENDHAFAGVVSAVCDLEAWELQPEVEAAFARGVVDEGFIDLEFFNDCQSQTLRGQWAEFCERHRPITDVADATKWLDESYEDLTPPSETGESRIFSDSGEPYIAPPKVGRNEPCPCGSGKKYKKCCGG